MARFESTLAKLTKRHVTKSTPIPTNITEVKSLRKDLDGWLEGRTCWNHEDWLNLLGGLRTKGYSDLIDTPKGQEMIGLYLESNRNNKCGSC